MLELKITIKLIWTLFQVQNRTKRIYFICYGNHSARSTFVFHHNKSILLIIQVYPFKVLLSYFIESGRALHQAVSVSHTYGNIWAFNISRGLAGRPLIWDGGLELGQLRKVNGHQQLLVKVMCNDDQTPKWGSGRPPLPP